jgi:alpha-galactosidase
MPKIVLVGAGSVVFTRTLVNDILLTPALRDCDLVLMDPDPGRLAETRDLVEMMIRRRGTAARVAGTTDRRDAVRGADYVITTFQVGGLEAYALDIEIPQRYGVEQCIGDTLGPGGVFRALRSIPVLLDLCLDLDEVAPEALLLNYVNPMAANCWAVDRGTGRPVVGLCESAPRTARTLARWVNVPFDEVWYTCVGINHQAFFLEFRLGPDDLYPRVRAAAQREHIRGEEPVRIDLMDHFGYFVTESSMHASEYVPYFRKTAHQVETELVPRFTSGESRTWWDHGRTGGDLRYIRTSGPRVKEDYRSLLSGEQALPGDRSDEPAPRIIEAIESNRPARVHGNVPNHAVIPNLPDGCCVEVPCIVDGRGLRPDDVPPLPPQLAALNRTGVNVQELTVEAVLTGKREHVYHAIQLDPLTAAACTLPQIKAMVDELFEAQARWLPGSLRSPGA